MGRARFFQVIDMMRFPLVVLVVYAHMLGFEHEKVTLSLDGNEIYIFGSELISHNLAKLPVRFYFLISGLFFFRGFSSLNKDNYNTFLVKKIRNVLFPYIFWNIAIVLFSLIINNIAYLFNIKGLHSQSITLSSIFNSNSIYEILWNGPANFPLWYMRDLICMMIISPLIYFYIKRFKILGVLLLLCFYLFGLETEIPGFSTTALLFFTVGGYFEINGYDFLGFCERYKKISFIGSLIMLFIATCINGEQYYNYALKVFIIFGIVSLVNVFIFLLKFQNIKNWLIGLSSTSFFIYVFHEIYIINWLKGGFSRTSLIDTAFGKWIGYIIIPIICIIICISVFRILEKISPQFLKLSTGDRSAVKSNRS